MKILLKLPLILMLVSSVTLAEKVTQWVNIGEGTFNHGFSYPYKIKLFVPYGVRNVADLKEGLLPMKFTLSWLPIEYSQKEVQKLFRDQLRENYDDAESFELAKHIVGFFIDKLPAIKKHDQWNFIYYPDIGAKLYIDNTKIHHLVGAEFNRALIQSWLTQSPVLTSSLFSRLLKLKK